MESKIKKCQKCSEFGYSCPMAPIAFVGKDYDGIVLIGESPHRTWVESGSPFCDEQGKLTPSAKRIFEYLEILGRTKEDIALLEAAKCVVNDRKDLSKMIQNCQEFLSAQIEEYRPKVVFSFGKTVTNSLSEMFGVVAIPCNVYKLQNFVYIPLHHPSPANPTGHKKNLEFLNELVLNGYWEKEWKK